MYTFININTFNMSMPTKKVIKKGVKKNTKKNIRKKVKQETKKADTISETLAIVCLFLNFIIPGIGSLVGEKTEEGIMQLTLLFGSIVIGIVLTITVIGAIIGIPLLIFGVLGAWIWSFVTGIKLIRNSVR